ncbi:hypothetical protein HA402_006830 [Bradysia odoriphaga]|uniref:Odorant-binding protein 40 n=1 Tax=Bradysia odoriphaga TaxID=1564500 RepID=A0A2S0X9J6_9DIPT|nr:odorant-binding protein 40 [Bradysia odoriphaga]KAG4069815.1 hypothetical protein HA402_006830 [Bradysia odoriphaga]
MMKLNKVVAVVAVFLIGFCGNALSDNAEMDKIVEICKAKEKATDADIEIWRSDPEPKPRMVKCLEACVGEQMGMMTTDNKISVDAVLKFYATETKDEKAVANMKEVLNECKAVTDKDRCESSAKILKCINDGTRKRGMKEMF